MHLCDLHKQDTMSCPNTRDLFPVEMPIEAEPSFLVQFFFGLGGILLIIIAMMIGCGCCYQCCAPCCNGIFSCWKHVCCCGRKAKRAKGPKTRRVQLPDGRIVKILDDSEESSLEVMYERRKKRGKKQQH